MHVVLPRLAVLANRVGARGESRQASSAHAIELRIRQFPHARPLRHRHRLRGLVARRALNVRHAVDKFRHGLVGLLDDLQSLRALVGVVIQKRNAQVEPVVNAVREHAALRSVLHALRVNCDGRHRILRNGVFFAQPLEPPDDARTQVPPAEGDYGCEAAPCLPGRVVRLRHERYVRKSQLLLLRLALSPRRHRLRPAGIDHAGDVAVAAHDADDCRTLVVGNQPHATALPRVRLHGAVRLPGKWVPVVGSRLVLLPWGNVLLAANYGDAAPAVVEQHPVEHQGLEEALPLKVDATFRTEHARTHGTLRRVCLAGLGAGVSLYGSLDAGGRVRLLEDKAPCRFGKAQALEPVPVPHGEEKLLVLWYVSHQLADAVWLPSGILEARNLVERVVRVKDVKAVAKRVEVPVDCLQVEVPPLPDCGPFLD